MLDFAQNHEKELAKKMRDTWGKKKYWYYHRCSYFSQEMIKEDTWNNTQFVSLNSAGEVSGYLGYGIDRECRYVTYMAIINFSGDISFGFDVMNMVKDIFEVYRYRKIVFTVVIGNPVEQKYDRLIERYGGRIVGIHKEHVMLPNGRYYDEKIYEISRKDYYACRWKISIE